MQVLTSLIMAISALAAHPAHATALRRAARLDAPPPATSAPATPAPPAASAIATRTETQLARRAVLTGVAPQAPPTGELVSNAAPAFNLPCKACPCCPQPVCGQNNGSDFAANRRAQALHGCAETSGFCCVPQAAYLGLAYGGACGPLAAASLPAASCMVPTVAGCACLQVGCGYRGNLRLGAALAEFEAAELGAGGQQEANKSCWQEALLAFRAKTLQTESMKGQKDFVRTQLLGADYGAALEQLARFDKLQQQRAAEMRERAAAANKNRSGRCCRPRAPQEKTTGAEAPLQPLLPPKLFGFAPAAQRMGRDEEPVREQPGSDLAPGSGPLITAEDVARAKRDLAKQGRNQVLLGCALPPVCLGLCCGPQCVGGQALYPHLMEQMGGAAAHPPPAADGAQPGGPAALATACSSAEAVPCNALCAGALAGAQTGCRVYDQDCCGCCCCSAPRDSHAPVCGLSGCALASDALQPRSAPLTACEGAELLYNSEVDSKARNASAGGDNAGTAAVAPAAQQISRVRPVSAGAVEAAVAAAAGEDAVAVAAGEGGNVAELAAPVFGDLPVKTRMEYVAIFLSLRARAEAEFVQDVGSGKQFLGRRTYVDGAGH